MALAMHLWRPNFNVSWRIAIDAGTTDAWLMGTAADQLKRMRAAAMPRCDAIMADSSYPRVW